MDAAESPQMGRHSGTAMQVFLVFLKLGLTSFGGPVAHLGYFRTEFVERRKWLRDGAYADLVALCQFLPGPASSQVGMAIGLQRAGMRGLIAAWLGFTLPSALLMFGFALGISAIGDPAEAGWVRGLNAAAVAVVAHALLGMARTLTPDARRATIAVGVMILFLLLPGPLAMLGGMAVAGIAGLLWLAPATAGGPHDGGTNTEGRPRLSRGVALGSLGTLVALLIGLPILAAITGDPGVRLIDAFTRAGSLVFGGGHVVLPLLEAGTVQTGLVEPGTFLAGYGAAQALPGPLFAFAAFLGAAVANVPTGGIEELGVLGALGAPWLQGVFATLALVAVFLPSALLVIGVLPFWEAARSSPRVRRALAGVNAGVVGLLAAALYDPVFTTGITGPLPLGMALLAFTALHWWRAPAWIVVLAAAGAGALLL